MDEIEGDGAPEAALFGWGLWRKREGEKGGGG
jgi:hypothetical protein